MITRVGPYRVHSEHHGSGPPVVLLHGLSGSRRWWRFTVPALAERFTVHVPELVGFGGSRRRMLVRQPDMQEMAEVVIDWMHAVGATDPVRLVGHSMGGQLALHIAAEQEMPHRLVLVNASGLLRPWTLPEAARLLSAALPPRSWGAPAFLPTIAADAVRAGPRTLLHATRHLLRDDVSSLLGRITCPTLLLWGALDPLVPVSHGEVMRDGITDARLVVLENAAHNAMADQPELFNRVLLEFLDE
ncbi:MAG TPA: alpha/beta fold hydrolase [Longimicrobiales bacterium]|nr:alpha/beta fold hydrolase [Longimicrobiales bacterium]